MGVQRRDTEVYIIFDTWTMKPIEALLNKEEAADALLLWREELKGKTEVDMQRFVVRLSNNRE